MPDAEDARGKLIVALDLDNVEAARALVATLGEAVSFYKIGMELAYGGGLTLAHELKGAGKSVFLDLKLHDIGATVERATKQVARMGVDFLTVHAYPQTMTAARFGAGDNLKVLAVTVMTSYDDADLEEAGYAFGVDDLIVRRAIQAGRARMDGLVLSPLEVEAIRGLVGSDMLLVTPGVRPAGDEKGDQKRVLTPGEAIRAGANHLVVGRPITRANDPSAAAYAVIAEISAACGR